MFKTILKSSSIVKEILNIQRVNVHTSRVVNEKWDLLTAVFIERKPIICPELVDIEKDFKNYLSTVEFERSLKSDTEVKLEKERSTQQQDKDIDDIDVVAKQTTQDFLDACKEELTQFTPASRITKWDKSSDVKSLQRKLDKPLVLVLKQKVGEDNFYLLPQAMRQEGETLRQAAERTVKEKCGPNIKVQIFGNAPCGFYKYKYPKKLRIDGKTGAKVFIYFARYASGAIENKADYKWLDKSELDHTLVPEYKKSVLPILFD